MADWPGPYGGAAYEAVGLAASTSPVNVVSNATANVEGAWVQIIASTANDCDGFWLSINTEQGETLIANCLVDIGIGADGSEVELLSDILFDSQNNKPIQNFFFVPIPIPAGTRIAARNRASAVSTSVLIGLVLQSGAFLGSVPSCPKCDTYGADTSDSGGTSLDPGATVNTEGAWTVLTTSCANDVKAILIKLGNASNSTRSNFLWRLDLGVGGAGSEVEILSDISFNAGVSSDSLTQTVFGPFLVEIPSGTRISLRVQCSGTTSPARLVDAAIYCFG